MYVYNPQRMRGCINPAAQSTSERLTIVASFQWAIPVNKDTPPWKNTITFPPMIIIKHPQD